MVWGALIGGVLGMGASAIGASQQQAAANKQIKINHKMAKQNWQYENEEQDRRVEFNKEGLEIKKKNNIRDAKWQDETNLKNWQMNVMEGDFKYVNQLMAKMESDRVLNENLHYNIAATDQALRMQDNWKQDRYQEREFNLMDMGLVVAKAKDDMGSAFNDILLNAAKQRNDVFHSMDKVQYERNVKKMEISFRSQDNQVDKLIQAGKAQNLQSGRSGSKAEQSAEAAGGRKEAELTQQATNIFKLASMNLARLNADLMYVNQDTANKKKAVGRQYFTAKKQTRLSKFKTWESWRSAQKQDAFQRDDILLSKKQADMNARANNMLMPMRGPIPPPPFATPMPDYQQPLDHVWSPKPIEGAAQTGAVMGAIAGALPGIGGALDAGFKTGWK